MFWGKLIVGATNVERTLIDNLCTRLKSSVTETYPVQVTYGVIFRITRKNGLGRRHCSISWPIVLQYDVKAISRMFSGMKFFRRSVRLTNQSYARLYLFDKPVKSLNFRLFVVSVLQGHTKIAL